MKTTSHSPSESAPEPAGSGAREPVAPTTGRADDAGEALSAKTARLEDDVGQLVEALSEQVARLAREATRLSVEKGGAAQDALAAIADECAVRIRQKPLQSVAVAAAAGALLAVLLRRRD